MHFPGHVTNQKVVANDLSYLNIDFQPNPSFQTGENGQKPSKMAIFDKKIAYKKKIKKFFRHIGLTKCVSLILL